MYQGNGKKIYLLDNSAKLLETVIFFMQNMNLEIRIG